MQADYLTQDPYTFDQTDKGWRGLDSQEKYLEAAELIESYLKDNEELIHNQDKVSMQTIHFHAGQEYAMLGKEYYQQAVEHLLQALKDKHGWDLYVKGTVAFLQRDRDMLVVCASKLRDAATNDPKLESNAELLENFLAEVESSTVTYAQIYG